MREAVTAEEMQQLEDELFSAGVRADWLMEQAGQGLSRTVERLAPSEPGMAVLYAGSGHNAGDGYVLLRELARSGWRVVERRVKEVDFMKPLTRRMRGRVPTLRSWRGDEVGSGPLLVIDGLVGIGARPPLRGVLVEAVGEINQLRERGAWVVAIDGPTGLDIDSGEVVDALAVRVDLTVTFGRVKRGLLADGAEEFVGRLERVALPGIEVDDELTTGAEVARWLPQRTPGWHKGTAGRVAVLAGSAGMTGAAQLCAEGALCAGAGLVTIWADESSAAILAGRVASEVMVRVLDSPRDLSGKQADVFAAGPGLGSRAEALLSWYRSERRPVVADADLLNALAGKEPNLWRSNGPRVWTPHPGEARRLLSGRGGEALEYRADRARWLAARARAAVLLKGARTVVGTAEGRVRFNSTGHPGMASGGMGDVLTGIIAALLAQGLEPAQAAAAGAWLHGRAAELDLREGRKSVESCRASSVLEWLGAAFGEAAQGQISSTPGK